MTMENADGLRLYPFEDNEAPVHADVMIIRQHIALSDNEALGKLVLQLDISGDLQILREHNQVVFALVIAGFVVSMVLMMIIFNRFVNRPVQELQRATTALAKGQYDTRMPDHSGDEIGALIDNFLSMRDAIRANERNLNDALTAAESANKAKSEFLAAMSHEIRTPMTAVMGFSDLLNEEDLSQENMERVAQIRSACTRLLRIINDVLDMSKLEAGKVQIEKIDFELSALVEEILSLFRESGKIRPGTSLISHIKPDVPRFLHGDPTRIRQILMNLVGNAVKFTQEGQVRVTIGVQESHYNQDNLQLHIAVTDTGIGMSTETQSRIFSSFTQADASTTRLYEGTGLGLAIAKQLVTLMGGTIGVESKEGTGSRFWFTLPVEKNINSAGMEMSAPPSKHTKRSSARRLSILYAEDNPVNQLLVKQYLSKFRHETDLVNDGAEAVARIRQGATYDLIMMDLRMPVMDGLEATRAIRSLNAAGANIPIIALTADAMADNVAICLEAGMNGFVSKPIDWQELQRTFNNVIPDDADAFADHHAS